jgi:hypothetical protein
MITNFDHANRVIRAVLGTRTATDTSLIIDIHFTIIKLATDRTCGALDHANGITAMHASIRHHDSIIDRPIAQEPRVIVMRRSAGSHTIITPSTTIHVDQHGSSSIHEPISHQELNKSLIDIPIRSKLSIPLLAWRLAVPRRGGVFEYELFH